MTLATTKPSWPENCTLKEATEAEKEAALQDLQVGFPGGQWDGWMEGHGAQKSC